MVLTRRIAEAKGQEYTDVVVHDYEDRLDRIFDRQVNRVQVLDFEGLTKEMSQAVTGRLRMEHNDSQGKIIFTSHAWRQLFEIRGPLVHELMLEFFSTCRISDAVLELDVVETLCFQLGELRRQMSWRQIILALGLHTVEEMASDGIDFDGDFLGPIPSDTSIRDPLRRLCHMLIVFSIFGRGQTPEKVTTTYLFYLRSMDEGTADVLSCTLNCSVIISFLSYAWQGYTSSPLELRSNKFKKTLAGKSVSKSMKESRSSQYTLSYVAVSQLNILSRPQALSTIRWMYSSMVMLGSSISYNEFATTKKVKWTNTPYSVKLNTPY
ncbi:hypothetical protein Tco_0368158 [Tanacetum coccineum]